LHLFGYLYNWQMGFNSVFKGLMYWFPKQARKSVRHAVVKQL
jgi:hypothetical protein